MSLNTSVVYLLAILCGLMATPAQAGVPRAFVASYGLDSNTAFNCDVTHPCRWFRTAVTVVNSEGEVIVLDSGGYGTVTLTKSISLTSPPGIYAGIGAFAGDTGVTIATPNVNVVLRGLTIIGHGGVYGINVNAGAKVLIDKCVISNFVFSGTGIIVEATATVHIVDSIVHNNYLGIQVDEGGHAIINASKFLGNIHAGIQGVSINGANGSIHISDTIVTGSRYGILTDAESSGTFIVNISRSSISENTEVGILVSVYGGTAAVTLGYSSLTGNGSGFNLNSSSAKLYSQGNNMITNNGDNTGVLTPLAPQ